MDRRHLNELATELRKRFESIWFDNRHEFNDKRYQIYAKCRGLVVGDRMENSVFHHGDDIMHRRAFDY
jgi:hypothetical protein